MLAFNLASKQVAKKCGGKYVWMLYLGGALTGALAMNYLMPYYAIKVPIVGADPSISAFISFIIMQNPSATLFHFILPFKYWYLLICGSMFLIVTDSSFKNMGGLTAGIALGLLKKRLFI
jgi:membrane associated rhomboid family serine protease